MIANYHTHTARCRHAEGEDEAYIARALEAGFQELGFSDHTPYWFETDHYSKFRMFPEQLPEYCNSIRALQAKYADKIQIHIGLEAEYYPKLFPTLLQQLRDNGVEYLLLGQHYLGNEEDCWDTRNDPIPDDVRLERTCNQMIDALYTGAFSCIAHPDAISVSSSAPSYKKHIRRLCKVAKECDVPLELNLLGLRKGRTYPDKRFWEIAGEEGCKAILGSDAHAPQDVWIPENEQQAHDFLAEIPVTLLQTLPLKKV